MHDINFIRKEPELFEKLMAKRMVSVNYAKILELDSNERNLKTKIQKLQNDRNILSRNIGEYKKKGQNTTLLEKSVSLLKENIMLEETKLKETANELKAILLRLPNLPADDVPTGKDESSNVEVYKSPIETSTKNYLTHDDIGRKLNMMDFESASKISGARFVILNKSLAKLERALCNFMIDLHVEENGYTEVSTPHLVNEEALIGTGQLPKFEEDLFKVNNKKWLIPTGEVTLTNLHSNNILNELSFPLRYVALTNCYRSEAGAAGKDTKGMIRLHEFKKVELVSFVLAKHSNNELERLTNCATKVIEYLQIPFRKVILSTGDMGFAANKTYDLEVWMPSQKKYREISSCSNCTDFQARRMLTRCKDIKGNKDFIHTLNGSGVAVGRALVAILENYQFGNNKVKVPDVLVEYMGGKKEISI